MRARTRVRFAVLSAVVVVAAAPMACERDADDQQAIYLGDVAHASLTVKQSEGLPRTTTIVETYPGDVAITTTAVLDTEGFVVEAKWKRVAPSGTRSRALVRRAMGLEVVEEGRSQAVGNLRLPVVLLSTASEVSREGPVRVVALDAAESVAGRVKFVAGKIVVETESGIVLSTIDADGNRFGPGAFRIGRKPARAVEDIRPAVANWKSELSAGAVIDVAGADLRDLRATVTGQRNEGHRNGARIRLTSTYDVTPPTMADRQPKLAFERDDPGIQKAFVRAKGATSAQDALFAVTEIGRLWKSSESQTGPASGRLAWQSQKGDCDDATALLVAWMRARGHVARAVVGYRLAGGVATPHAWAEYWTGDRWEAADAMWPAVGIIPANVRLFDGLGSTLTIGRTLGSVTFSIVDAATSAP